MMTCHDVESFLDDDLDGSLPWGTRVRFEFHLRMCGECRRYIARYETTIEASVPTDLIAVILRSVREQD